MTHVFGFIVPQQRLLLKNSLEVKAEGMIVLFYFITRNCVYHYVIPVNILYIKYTIFNFIRLMFQLAGMLREV